MATTLDDIALYRLQHLVSSHFQTDRVSLECNSRPFPGQFGVTTGLLLLISDQIRTLPITRTEAELGRIWRALRRGGCSAGHSASLEPLSGAGGLYSVRFQAVLPCSPASISPTPWVLFSSVVPGARWVIGNKET